MLGLGAARRDGFLPGFSIVINLYLEAIDRRVRIAGASAEVVNILLQPVFRSRIVGLVDSPKDIVLHQFVTGALLYRVAAHLRRRTVRALFCARETI